MTEICISFDQRMITVLNGPSVSELWDLRARMALQGVIETISYDRQQRAPIVHLHENMAVNWIADQLKAMET